jgi:hypothetical protein
VDSVVRLLVAALAVMLAVLASMGPIVAFFSVSTTSHPFMVLVNVVVFAVSGTLGLSFLLQTLQRLSDAPRQPLDLRPAEAIAVDESEPSKDQPPGALEPIEGQEINRHVKTIFRCWVVLFGLVGAQMGWVLRPFIGNPAIEFTWFRGRDSNFFQGVLTALWRLFS